MIALEALPAAFTPVNPRLAEGAPIERRENLSPAEFEREYARRNKPVILTGVLDHWAALGKWTPEFFAQTYPDKLLKFKYGGLEMKMKDFIPLVMESSPEHPAPYWTNNVVEDYFPELVPDISPLPVHTQPNWAARSFLHKAVGVGLNRGAKVEIYIGGPGGAFPVLHWDGMSTHAFLMQLHGLKQYWVWPPADQALMYPKDGPEWNLSPIRDVENPDLEKYPLFARARCTTFVLEPGEMLFVPSRWWHTAKMLTHSITLSVNTLNDTNWANFREDMTRRASGPAKCLKCAYLGLEHLRLRLGKSR
ncbi:MAG TPA: cupin-like domain-containing protein [Verrucomicrobiales bacterium]|nr:cupin-like domain-containing protein [Verrucomicrobiales bacterium]